MLLNTLYSLLIGGALLFGAPPQNGAPTVDAQAADFYNYADGVLKGDDVIVRCGDCKQTTYGVVSQSNLKRYDWYRAIARQPSAPGWVVGEVRVPIGKRSSCASLSQMFSTGTFYANQHRAFGLALQSGSAYAVISSRGMTMYKVGSREHRAAIKALSASSNNAYKATRTILEAMDGRKCLKPRK